MRNFAQSYPAIAAGDVEYLGILNLPKLAIYKALNTRLHTYKKLKIRLPCLTAKSLQPSLSACPAGVLPMDAGVRSASSARLDAGCFLGATPW